MKYGIAIFPSKKLQDMANALRKRYDPHYALIPPHITIKSAFEIDNEAEIAEIVGEINEIAKTIQPFSLHVYKVGSFHPVNNVIYFGVKPTSSLTELHDKLNEGKLKREEPYNFVPHITIAQGLSDDEHADVYGSLKLRNMNHEETIDRFQLLYQLENESWTVYETFHLGRED
ncbi:MAG TPA: YjcG family protein [Bacillales bacterium]|nr:YjcG family protein [Bacillales bacterium]